MPAMIVADIMSIYLIGLLLIGSVWRTDRRKSTHCLNLTMVGVIVALALDCGAYMTYEFAFPDIIVYFIWLLFYLSGTLALIPFVAYCYCYLNERIKTSWWTCVIPVGLLVISLVWAAIEILKGDVYYVQDGKCIILNEIPKYLNILVAVGIMFVPVFSLIRHRNAGKKSIVLLGFFGIVPILTAIFASGYKMIVGAIELEIIVMFMQNNIAKEREEHRKILELTNEKLEAQYKENEIERERSELKIKTIAEAIHGGFKISKNDGIYTLKYVSEQLAEMLGYSVDEFLLTSGGSMAGIVNLEDARSNLQQASMSISRGEMYTMNYRIRCRDGSWKNVEDRGKVFQNGDEEEVWSFLIDKDDYAAKQKALDEAHRANEYLRVQNSIISSLTNVFNTLYYVDIEDYTFIELSSRMSEVHDMIGATGNAVAQFEVFYEKILKPEYIPAMRVFNDLDTVNERMKDVDLLSQPFEGSYGWSEAFIIVCSRDYDGKVKNIIWGSRNINEQVERDMELQKQLESERNKAEVASRAKTTFLFNMSHDIRTPMNAIIGYSDLVENNLDDREKVLDYMAKIRTANQVLLSLINNVLELARIESGKVVLDESYWEIGNLAESVESVFSYQMKNKNMEFTKSIDVEHRYVICDHEKIGQILLNLLSNALKYTPEGGKVSLEISELPSERDGVAMIQIVVRDTGIGMTKEYVEHIFEEFSRERNSTESRIQGTGLGMAIVKQLVDLMGGSIDIESEVGQGTCITVVIPHRITEKQDTSSFENDADDEKIIPDGMSILLAEDNELNAEIAIAVLEEHGCKVDRAEDGIQCIEKLLRSEAGKYDVILMDIQMPNMNGYMATERIRQLEDPQRAGIPIIAMTANAFEEDRQNAINAGMNGHIAKPIDVENLMHTLAETVK